MQHEDQRGQEPAGASHPERAERDASGRRELAEQQRGDEEAGEHEEHVDADEPGRRVRVAGVEQDHRDHGERADAVERRLVGERRRAVVAAVGAFGGHRSAGATVADEREEALARRRTGRGSRVEAVRADAHEPGRVGRGERRARRSRPRRTTRGCRRCGRAGGGGGSRSPSPPVRTASGRERRRSGGCPSSLTLPKMPHARSTSAGTAPAAASVVDASPVTTSTRSSPAAAASARARAGEVGVELHQAGVHVVGARMVGRGPR